MDSANSYRIRHCIRAARGYDKSNRIDRHKSHVLSQVPAVKPTRGRCVLFLVHQGPAQPMSAPAGSRPSLHTVELAGGRVCEGRESTVQTATEE